MGFWSLTCCENPTLILENFFGQFSNPNMTCESCGIRFSFLKKKKKCQECLKDFCSACVWRDAVLLPRQQLCRTCHTLTTVPLDRSDLMQLRIRELQHFLMARNIPVNSCTEKRDLVDLVIRFSARSYSPTSSPSRTSNVQSGDSTQEATYPPSQFTTPTATSANDLTKDAANQESGDGEKKLRIEDILDLDVEQLSIRQLKEILSRSFVTYKGCCEKGELIGKVKQLQAEAKDNHLRVMQGLPEENTCKICMDAPIDCVLLECGHMLSCTKCGQLLSECPVCRQFVVRVVHTFRA